VGEYSTFTFSTPRIAMEHNSLRNAAESNLSALLPRRPRTLIVTAFALALLFALLLPLAQLWRASMTPLEAQACVWPRVPLVGQPAQIVVTLPAATAHAAGSWTRAVVEWDMISMRMGVRRATTAPSAAQNTGRQSAIAIPLALDMAGAWAAHVLLQAPGRPDWTATLTFNALGSDQAAKALAPTGGAECAQSPARAGASPGGTP
jgi:hypothetical protein